MEDSEIEEHLKCDGFLSINRARVDGARMDRARSDLKYMDAKRPWWRESTAHERWTTYLLCALMIMCGATAAWIAMVIVGWR